ncbi:MAG TPA: hypothetical protein VFF40_04915 [Acidimicrobiia bacterium]|nr:hypothetical protein [Acidimicrobiia bacterium]
MRSPRRAFRHLLRRIDAHVGRRRRVQITRVVAIVAVTLAIVGDVMFLVVAARGGGHGTDVAQASTAAVVGTSAAGSTGPTATAPVTPESQPPATEPPTAEPTQQQLQAYERLVEAAESSASALAPAGGSASIVSDPAACFWEPSAGGTLHAAGTVTNPGSDEDSWLVDVTWNEDGDLFDSESDFVDTGGGQTKPWAIALADIEAPAGALTCSVELF